MKKITIAMMICLTGLYAVAQTNLELANEAFTNRDYITALDLLQKVLKKPDKKTDVAELKFKVAESYRYTGQYDKALEWYEQAKAEGYSNANYLFHEGTIYLKQGNYEKAKQKFESFLERVPNDKEATRLVNNCKFALTAATEPSVYTFRNESSLNTLYNDYGAVPVKDRLLFTSGRLLEKGAAVYGFDGQGFTDIYQTVYIKEDKAFTKAKPVEILNSPFNNGEFTWCERTKTAYFGKCNDGKSKNNFCSIMETSWDDASGNWTSPKPISLSFVQKADMEQPAISADGKKLYFVSRIEGGQGGTDIWFMRKSDDKWDEPVNAGSVINTEFDEMFPAWRDSVLYFSSEGFTGYGALDLFSSIYSEGAFGKPQNLKAPFNSSGDDFLLVMNSDGKSGYYSSNRSGGAGGDDIYSFFVTPVSLTVKGRISDVETGQPIAGATVIITTAGDSDTTVTNANGEYLFNLDADHDYKINVLNPGYFGDSRKLSTQGEKFSKEFSKATGNNYDFAIRRIPKEEIRIDDIYYDLDSYALREESKPSLDKLAKLLDDTPGAMVQINSHTDERGKYEYNITLSDNRAKSVVEYLVSKGISAGRLTWKGFGFTQPVIKNAQTEEEHQKNRRTTFQVLKND